LVFYYPWWDGYNTTTQTPRPKWSECTLTWSTSDGDTGDHYHPDFDANGVFDPAVDLYDDRDQNTVRVQMQRMRYASVSGLISSWWGPNSPENTKLRWVIWPVAQQRSGVKVTAYYETYRPDGSGTDPNEMKRFMDALLSLYKQNPARFVTLGGRPALFVYEPGNTNCSRLDQWTQALDYAQQRYGVRPYLLLDMGANIPSCFNWRRTDFGWHEYDPGSSGFVASVADGKLQTVTIRPGFWRCSRPTPGQPRELSGCQNNVHNGNASCAAYFQLITSWNEWLEMSSVEPAVEWYSPSGAGQYLDILATFPPYACW
jgi:hypothetical protein